MREIRPSKRFRYLFPRERVKAIQEGILIDLDSNMENDRLQYFQNLFGKYTDLCRHVEKKDDTSFQEIAHVVLKYSNANFLLPEIDQLRKTDIGKKPLSEYFLREAESYRILNSPHFK